MNKLTIIGNLTKDPELRQTPDNIPVCNFTVAVNHRKKSDTQPDADFFRVTAWRGLAETCQKYLAKGRKVCVIGSVSVRLYNAADGSARANMEVTADDVEFLTPKSESNGNDNHSGFTPVSNDELPWG